MRENCINGEMWVKVVDAGQQLTENVGDVITDLIDSLDREGEHTEVIIDAIKGLMKSVNQYQSTLITASKPRESITQHDLEKIDFSLDN